MLFSLCEMKDVNPNHIELFVSFTNKLDKRYLVKRLPFGDLVVDMVTFNKFLTKKHPNEIRNS